MVLLPLFRSRLATMLHQLPIHLEHERVELGQLLREEEKGTGYFSGDFRGRPRWRRVDSRPKVVAITACQSAVPKGCWRFTQVRSVVRS